MKSLLFTLSMQELTIFPLATMCGAGAWLSDYDIAGLGQLEDGADLVG